MRSRPDAVLRAPWWRYVVGSTVMLGIPTVIGGSVAGLVMSGTVNWELIGLIIAGNAIGFIAASPYALSACTLRLVHGKILGTGSFWRTVAIPVRQLERPRRSFTDGLHLLLGLRRLRRADGRSITVSRLWYSREAFEQFLSQCREAGKDPASQGGDRACMPA